MSTRADSLDWLADQLLIEARRLDGVGDTIEPLIARVIGAWEGPAADRLVSELGERRRELIALGSFLRSLAQQQRDEADRVRAAEAGALAGPETGVPVAGPMSLPLR